MPVARTVICKCSKCFWRRTATFGDASPIFPRYERCPLCGSPTTTTSRIAGPFDQTLDHVLGAMPLALALGAGALALDTLLKLAGKKGD